MLIIYNQQADYPYDLIVKNRPNIEGEVENWVAVVKILEPYEPHRMTPHTFALSILSFMWRN